VPDAPTSLVAMAIDDSSIGLAWDAPGDDGGSAIVGYQITAESPIGAGFSVVVADTGDTDTTAVISGLSAGTEYNFRVHAINAIGVGAPSNQSDATTDGGGGGGDTGGAFGSPTLGTNTFGT
jgi:hypothetical protein